MQCIFDVKPCFQKLTLEKFVSKNLKNVDLI